MAVLHYMIYPRDITFVPDDERVEQGLALLRETFPNSSIRWDRYEHPYFLHCGEGLDRIVCPACEQEMDARDWQDMMDAVYAATRFRVLEIATPCCGKNLPLNELIYEKHCGFARFCYYLKPGPQDMPLPDQAMLAELAKRIGCASGCALVVEEKP